MEFTIDRSNRVLKKNGSHSRNSQATKADAASGRETTLTTIAVNTEAANLDFVEQNTLRRGINPEV